MSGAAMAWVLHDAPGLPPQCFGVLMGLAAHADGRGAASYPGVPLLARYARKSERQVRYDLERLTGLGLIRPGDQSLASWLPACRRPVVYDLAVTQVRDLSEPGSPRYARKELPDRIKRWVLERDFWTCRHCGSHRDLTVDHIVAVSIGGSDEMSNLQTLCQPCNSKKGRRPDVLAR